MTLPAGPVKALRLAAALALLGGVVLLEATSPAPGEKPPTGFSEHTWTWEKAFEAKLQERVEAARCREHLRFLTRQPHTAGTPGNFRVSQYILEHFREYGLEAEFAEYDVLLAYPEEVRAEIVAPERVGLAQAEPAHPLDPLTDVSHDPVAHLPWNAYSPDADLDAPLLYANYGRPEDFRRLQEMGLTLEGKIVLLRYFEGYRGGKSYEAEKHGVAGILVYSDPMEDGYFQGEVWPEGPWGPPGHVQRGANVYDFLVPGDPLTPGWASTPGARRIAPEESSILPKIPMVPLSAVDAGEILRRLGGPAVPTGWQGALPFTYHVGDGRLRVHLVNRQRRVRTTIRNVIGKIRGTEFPDQMVLLSNHHDAWVYGAVDPGSGTATMLELAQVLGQLAREGYRPRRTVVFANWDAEEYTLTGSTEWGEQFAEPLRAGAVACLNVDAATSGSDFSVSASPLLRRLIVEATQAVADPQTGQPVYDRWAQAASSPNVRGYATGAAPAAGPPIARLGSGSDYTVFYNHLGIPSLDMLFDGPYGVYHSVYDGFVWMARFGDPEFRYHAAMARLWGVMALRLANADLLPFEPEAYAEALAAYVEELRPQAEPEFFARHLAPVGDEAHKLARAARRTQARLRRWLRNPNAHRTELGRANERLLQLERDFIHPEGLPDRPWFKHLVYAPRPSYRAQVLPGIAEALEKKDMARAAREARRLQQALERARKHLDEIR
ncbi:MAG: M28 family metallopeptidase [Acidobacteria bacterium]|nr:M28 family metallopeptidase [Acidobacteriota bacterium]